MRAHAAALGPNTSQAGLAAFNPRDETPEQARERRLRESQEYDSHATLVSSLSDWKTNLDAAGKNLVVVEVSRSPPARSPHATPYKSRSGSSPCMHAHR